MSPLHIPEGNANFHLSLINGSAGPSSLSTVAFGVSLGLALDQVAVDRIANILRDGLKARYDGTWFLGPVHVQETAFGGVHKVWDAPLQEAGTHAAMANVSPAVSLVVSKSTGRSGRAYRGRLYMPGLDETKVDEAGFVDFNELGLWIADFNALAIALAADAAVLESVLFHEDVALEPTVIQAYIPRNTVGTMRPRQRR